MKVNVNGCACEFTEHGEKVIQRLIEATKGTGNTLVTVSGNYLMHETVYLPSDITLVLKDCHLRMADGTFCNMFKNAACENFESRSRATADKNIKIVGEGRAILDGGNYNGLSERNSGKDGYPSVVNNNLLLFSNVDGFEIRNIRCINQRHWALNFYYCRYGKLSDIDFCADYTRIDENGNRVVGLDKSKYGQTYIKNADGIDLRMGCHDIIIENITGFTEDDTIALTALQNKNEKKYAVEGETGDIYNVVIRNIVGASFCTNVRLLNQGGTKLYNILVDGVQDSSLDEKYYVGRGVAGVRIGDAHLYGSRHATADETFNICVRNVFSRATCAFRMAGEMADVTYENIFGFDGCPQTVEKL